MSAPVYLTTIILIVGAVVVVFGMRYLALSKQAKAKLADGQGWRQVAEQAAAAQAHTASTLASMQASLAEVSTRLASVETLLKDVG
jgi:Tfp pilus assembly protein PilO